MSGAVLVMARAPRAGACKTRLEPLLGREGCAALQTELIRHTVEWALASGRPTWLAFDPADAQGQIARLVAPPVARFAQYGRHLGERLEDAVNRVAGNHAGPITVIGTDSPTIGARELDALEAALEGGSDAGVLGAYDGGYAALTLSRPLPSAFGLPADAWGEPSVLASTIALLRRQGLAVAVLDPVHDLDTPDDARRLAADPDCPHAIRAALTPAAKALA